MIPRVLAASDSPACRVCAMPACGNPAREAQRVGSRRCRRVLAEPPAEGDYVTSHQAIVEWPREEYERVIDGLQLAFKAGAASLYFDTHSSAHVIDVFNPSGATALTARGDWPQVSASIRYLDQFMAFAFEDAPDSLIRRWAKLNANAGDGEEAVYRVQYLRANAPAIAQQWAARATSAGYTFGDVQGDIVVNPAVPTLQLLLRFDVFLPGPAPRRPPVSSSRQWLSASMTANEVDRLISRLQSLKDFITPTAPADAEGVDAATGREGTESDDPPPPPQDEGVAPAPRRRARGTSRVDRS